MTAMDDRQFLGSKVDEEGRKVSNISFPASDLEANRAALPEGWRIIEGHQELSSDEWYFLPSGKPKPRPQIVPNEAEVAADGMEVFRLDLPLGAQVFYRGAPDARGRARHEPLNAAGGKFEFVSAIPGIYEFDIEPPFPWQPVTLRITARAI